MMFSTGRDNVLLMSEDGFELRLASEDGVEAESTDWISVEHPTYKRIFYYNKSTRRSSWTKPDLLAPPDCLATSACTYIPNGLNEDLTANQEDIRVASLQFDPEEKLLGSSLSTMFCKGKLVMIDVKDVIVSGMVGQVVHVTDHGRVIVEVGSKRLSVRQDCLLIDQKFFKSYSPLGNMNGAIATSGVVKDEVLKSEESLIIAVGELNHKPTDDDSDLEYL